jgi:hypothetical protein
MATSSGKSSTSLKVEKLEKRIADLEKELRGLKAMPKSSGVDADVKAELSRVAKLVDRIVQVIKSPSERITDRNLRF